MKVHDIKVLIQVKHDLLDGKAFYDSIDEGVLNN